MTPDVAPPSAIVAPAVPSPSVAPVVEIHDASSDRPAEPRPSWAPPFVHTAVFFTTARLVEAALWPDPFADTNLGRIGARYKETFTKPPVFDPKKPAFRWDGDPLVVNVLGHGLMGSELYMRTRTCHFGPLGALAFAAGATVVWEYAFEGNGVRPSALDLVYTPLAGMLLGEARYFFWRRAASIERPFARHAVRAIVDPFGELERAIGVAPC